MQENAILHICKKESESNSWMYLGTCLKITIPQFSQLRHEKLNSMNLQLAHLAIMLTRACSFHTECRASCSLILPLLHVCFLGFSSMTFGYNISSAIHLYRSFWYKIWLLIPFQGKDLLCIWSSSPLFNCFFISFTISV